MKIIFFLHLFTVIFSENTAETLSAASIIFFDNFNDGQVNFGPEETILDYVELANDPVSNLPKDFTLCSSLYIRYMTTKNNFVEFFQANGSQWFQLDIEHLRDLSDFTERITMHFNGKSHKFWKSGMPINPHSWYHICLGLDTESGRLRVVINGYSIVDEDIPYFKDSQNKRPQSLVGKINVFKTLHVGYWYNTRNIFSNMNVFSRILSKDSMILHTNGPDCAAKGDYLSWNEMKWNISGQVKEGSVSVEELCQRANHSSVLLPTTFVSWQKCMDFCPKFRRARALSIHTKAEAKELANWGYSLNEKTGFGFWIAYTDKEKEGSWIDYYTNEPANAVEAQNEVLNGGTTENCALFVSPWYGWNDWSCEINKAQPINCACRHPQQMYMQMRGLCEDSNIDQYFVPQNMKGEGSFILVGLKNTVIEFVPSESVWKMTVFGTSQNTSATADSSKTSYLLGSHTWTIKEDYKECSVRGKPYTRRLKLTGCREGEFTCTDGQCISMVQRCDQIVHCRDKSDEVSCSLLVIEESYNKKVPPFNIDKEESTLIPVKVNVSTILKNVIEISEVNHIIELKFAITLVWYENRVKYHNLKVKEALNVLSDTELEALWIPYIIFDNTDNEDAVTIYDARSMVSIKQEGSFYRSGPEVADEIEIFNGEENRITMNQTHSKKFHCTYLLQFFPFDTQVCSMKLKLDQFDQETVEMIPDVIDLQSSTELTQYFIKTWSLTYTNQDDVKDGIKMEIVFKRRLTNELLTTYLPTFLLLGITYATTFFKLFFFEAALTVNLTAMLVITTLFISVMEKLPPTSYVRMVDVWLIFGQLIPFIEVTLLTIMEHYNVEEDKVNHHGTAISIKNPDINTVKQAFTRTGDELIENGGKQREKVVLMFFKKILGDTDIAKWTKITEKKIVPTLVLAFFCVYWTFGFCCYSDIIKTY